MELLYNKIDISNKLVKCTLKNIIGMPINDSGIKVQKVILIPSGMSMLEYEDQRSAFETNPEQLINNYPLTEGFYVMGIGYEEYPETGGRLEFAHVDAILHYNQS